MQVLGLRARAASVGVWDGKGYTLEHQTLESVARQNRA